MAHENHPSKFHGNFMVQMYAMKPEISVFMAIKNAFMGFSRHFHGIFMKKKLINPLTPGSFLSIDDTNFGQK